MYYNFAAAFVLLWSVVSTLGALGSFVTALDKEEWQYMVMAFSFSAIGTAGLMLTHYLTELGQ